MKLQRFVRDIPKFERAQISDMLEHDEDSAAQRDSVEQLFGINGDDVRPRSKLDSYTPVMYRIVKDSSEIE